jgi:pyruvate dehydrogenase E2 component (dihydrolipoamide acetyltransferase)
MGTVTEIKVPDIGDFKDVPVIEVMVKAGDHVAAEDSLIALESDKATMEVPAPAGGTVKEVRVKVGDKVSEGSLILLLDSGAVGAAVAPAEAPKERVSPPPSPTSTPGGIAEVRVPDIGDFKDVPVIEILVKPGETVKAEDALVTLESDKATMDVPSPLSGTVQEMRIKVGDKVSEGTILLTLATGEGRTSAPELSVSAASTPAPAVAAAAAPAVAPSPAERAAIDETSFALAYASPGVRKLARELSVDLGKVRGSGDKGRILREDVESAAKGAGAATSAATSAAPASATVASGGFDLLPWPKVDYAKFGEIESKPLSRIKKISAANLHRNWVMIPHVTNHDDADITDLEDFRVALNKEIEKSGVKVSMLSFMIKAAVATLRKFPDFNASLEGDSLILKKYYHIGFAADTPQGLVVPVIRDADRKGVVEIAKEMSELAKLARDGKLKPDQMQGGSFTISSLGGIGGTYFTPIINAPEVAILGVCRSSWRQVSPDGKTSAWRLMLPLSLSWDHRVIDGASAARFNSHFASLLGDMRRVLI